MRAEVRRVGSVDHTVTYYGSSDVQLNASKRLHTIRLTIGQQNYHLWHLESVSETPDRFHLCRCRKCYVKLVVRSLVM